MSPEARSSALGVLAVVLGWAGWAALHADDPGKSAPSAPAITAVAPVPQSLDRMRAVAAASESPPSNTSPPPAAIPAARLREGFVLEHGVVTAVRASANPRPAPRRDIDDAALPPGVSPADATLSPGGVVTVNRATRGMAREDSPQNAGSNPFRAPERTSSP